MRASKILYNEGLQKAKARDLSGAIELLNRSIKLNKENTDARNLLGLVYFEIGETVLAFRQWVISKNMQAKGNVANEYLMKVQENQSNLDKLSTSIKKYNQSLQYIQQGSSDLAMIQLKKILSVNPNFVKAYCLLALIYVENEEIEKAKKELVKVLAIDKSNYIARKYYDELQDEGEVYEITTPEEEVRRERKKVRRQVVINQSVQQFLGVVFGLAVGVALMYFLYMPSKIDLKDQIIEERDERLETAGQQITDLNDTLIANEDKIKELELDLTNAVSENEQLSSKDAKVQKLMLSMTTYLEGSLFDSAQYLTAVDIQDSTDGILNSLYEQLVNIVYTEAANKAYNEGLYSYNRYDYDTGAERFELAVEYITDQTYADDAHYYLGRCYQFLERSDAAIAQFKYVLSNFPDSDKSSYARRQIINLGGTVD